MSKPNKYYGIDDDFNDFLQTLCECFAKALGKYGKTCDDITVSFCNQYSDDENERRK